MHLEVGATRQEHEGVVLQLLGVVDLVGLEPLGQMVGRILLAPIETRLRVFAIELDAARLRGKIQAIPGHVHVSAGRRQLDDLLLLERGPVRHGIAHVLADIVVEVLLGGATQILPDPAALGQIGKDIAFGARLEQRRNGRVVELGIQELATEIDILFLPPVGCGENEVAPQHRVVEIEVDGADERHVLEGLLPRMGVALAVEEVRANADEALDGIVVAAVGKLLGCHHLRRPLPGDTDGGALGELLGIGLEHRGIVEVAVVAVRGEVGAEDTEVAREHRHGQPRVDDHLAVVVDGVGIAQAVEHRAVDADLGQLVDGLGRHLGQLGHVVPRVGGHLALE